MNDRRYSIDILYDTEHSFPLLNYYRATVLGEQIAQGVGVTRVTGIGNGSQAIDQADTMFMQNPS